MFGQGDNDEHKQDDQGHIGQVTAPTNGPPPNDDTASLGDDSGANGGLDASRSSGGFIMDPVTDPGTGMATPPAAATTTPVSDDLIHIKQEALQQLSPLVGHLNQSPEEKFRTTMMMIQASDDQSLLKTAYESAKQITDEKTRAQALLDVVNEINYFTQQHKSTEQ